MKKNILIIGVVFLVFFVISFLTNILGPIIPDIIEGFDLSLSMAGFLPFSFFIAYGVMSIPSGILIEKHKEKKVMIAAFALASIGASMFAFFPVYLVALPSLFIIGLGMAMLQVAINPLLRTAGGEENFAFNSVMAQLVFGGASFLSPQVYSYLVKNLTQIGGDQNIIISFLSGIVPEGLPWISLYWLFAVISVLMIFFLSGVKFPMVKLKDDEKVGGLETYKKMFSDKTVILFFVAIFAYVGTEQGIANWMSKFLESYHGFDPQIQGADAISYFWGLLTVGCFLGLLLLKFIDSRRVLIIFSGLAILALTAALFGSALISLIAFPACGFFASVMWSIIFSLALNSIKSNHGSFSGILCTGIIGGAILPLIVGGLGDAFGLRLGMSFLYISLGFIFSIGFWAKPLVNNKTIKFNRKFKKII
jgi:fucose permease